VQGGKGVFHEGEIAVQERTGERGIAERRGAMITSTITPNARPFLAQQQMLILAAGVPGGEVWASAWFGTRGFAESRDDGGMLWIDRPRVAALQVDPVGEVLAPGAAVGVLAIELETRRRLRVNGIVRELGDEGLALEVSESFPNCPKYIAKRRLRRRDPPEGAVSVGEVGGARGVHLDAARMATVRRTDTLFVASLHPARGADASHRGGDPGFVRIVDDRTLRIPDYTGNSMYQTLGNLHATGRAGLVFLDFVGRRLLHVTGATELYFDDDEASIVTGGTGRSWDLRIERWVEGALPTDFDADLLERSPVIPRS
jgi:predicted pyridoxine 5'-phosphate oxidase superfamily flavin-nucleotide-binding protein